MSVADELCGRIAFMVDGRLPVIYDWLDGTVRANTSADDWGVARTWLPARALEEEATELPVGSAEVGVEGGL